MLYFWLVVRIIVGFACCIVGFCLLACVLSLGGLCGLLWLRYVCLVGFLIGTDDYAACFALRRCGACLFSLGYFRWFLFVDVCWMIACRSG